MINKKGNFITRLGHRIYNKKMFAPFRNIVDILADRIEKSIRFELMVVVAIAFGCSFIFYSFSNNALKDEVRTSSIKYKYEYIDQSARNIADNIQSNKENLNLKDNIQFFADLISNDKRESDKAYITDLDGNVLWKSEGVVEDKIDIFSVIGSITNTDYNSENGAEKKIVYPLSIGEERCYFIYSGFPRAEIEYETYEVNNSFLALILSCIVFIIIFIVITNKKMKYLDEIANGLRIIANGKLDYHIEEKGNDEIRNLAANINNMADEINKKIIAERRAEQTKADLITNVSHDLRTPLTSIMGYIGLIKEGRYDNEETMKEYLDIAFSKAEKLKVLIEDLFEYTKLNNNGIQLNKIDVNLSEFIFQITEELTPMLEENSLTIIKNTSEEKIVVKVDPNKMVRVFENLIVNAIKYSFKPGKIVIGVYKNSDYATVVIRNKGNNIPEEKLNKLFDRFYRLDESRNEQTGGSGLGLAISKNIVQLHGGEIWAECYGEDISFCVKLKIEK